MNYILIEQINIDFDRVITLARLSHTNSHSHLYRHPRRMLISFWSIHLEASQSEEPPSPPKSGRKSILCIKGSSKVMYPLSGSILYNTFLSTPCEVDNFIQLFGNNLLFSWHTHLVQVGEETPNDEHSSRWLEPFEFTNFNASSIIRKFYSGTEKR